MRRLSLILIFVVCNHVAGYGQVAVFDFAVTFRNTLTAALKEYQITLQEQQHSQLRRMAQRLSMFTDLAKFGVSEAPRWRIHDFENAEAFRFSRAYHASLNYGDASGAGYESVSQPLVPSEGLLGRLTPDARRLMAVGLATAEVGGATIISGTHDSGRLRFNGRRELEAIDALDRDVTNNSLEQSTTAVLDKISGAVLVGTKQRQARVQLLADLVEQLLVDGKRARDSEALAMNMQLTSWRDWQAVDVAFVRGSGDALTQWRQP